VTGWVTCAGGSWNASIITEYFNLKSGAIATFGLGSAITEAAARADFPLLAASVLLMVGIVVAFNRLVWRPLYELAETKYALAK
jgi:NitT/TauT family transport system permease protein